jgi:hypothetical protein
MISKARVRLVAESIFELILVLLAIRTRPANEFN